MSIHVAIIFLIFYINFGFHITLNAAANNEENNEKKIILNEQIYTNVYHRRREEQQTLLKHLFEATESYEKRFKLMSIGYEKILAVLVESRDKLNAAKYLPSEGFPKSEPIIDAFALILENTALVGDMFLRQPEISYKVMATQKNWKDIINWSIGFCGNFINTILDSKTTELLTIFALEINPEHRPANYINPYAINESAQQSTKAKTKKPAKPKTPPPKRGPRLRGGGTQVHKEL